MEERFPDFGLEPSNLLTESRLGDLQTFCGAGEVKFLGNGQEVAKMTELYCPNHKF
jgi:hypothetical protein